MKSRNSASGHSSTDLMENNRSGLVLQKSLSHDKGFLLLMITGWGGETPCRVSSNRKLLLLLCCC